MKTLQLHEDDTRDLFDEGGVALALPSELDDARREKRWELSFAALRAEHAGFQFAGNTYASDTRSQQRITLNVLLAMRKAADFPMLWTTTDDKMVSFTAQEMQDLGVALAEHLDAVQAVARGLHAKLAVAATAQEVQAVVWP